MQPPVPLRALEIHSPKGAPTVVPELSELDTKGTPRALLCAACRAVITREDRRMEVDGRHAHTRVNPVGVEYHFGCFSEAEGCAVVGAPVSEESWFPGCAWQIATCRACGVHMGWLFTGALTFFGLVLERLVEEDDAPRA